MKTIQSLTTCCILLVAGASLTVAADSLQEKLAAAKPGQTVALPAGEFKGGVTLPPGVSLKGAGYGKTIIDATGLDNGIVIKGGSGATVSDLTVRGAIGAGVLVQDAEKVTVSRVRVTGAPSGFILMRVTQGRIENCLSDQNNFGIVVNGGSNCAVINCTVVDCVELGISLAASRDAVVFNNCVVGSGICLKIDKPANVQADHNLYFGLFVAQTSDQPTKKVLSGWQRVTVADNKPGLDLHSVQMPVSFTDATGGDFTPAGVVPWALNRAITADWGTAELAGVKAPATDINGRKRSGQFDVGAVESPVQSARPADGTFTVAKDAGVKSAGVFTKDGILVSYLFQNLPLPAGKYSFWLPVRDYVGQPIAAGDYEVRVAESDFQWKYLNHVGDNGGDRYGPYTASCNPKFVAFAGDDTLVMLQGPSEDHLDLRGFDAATGKVKWYIHGASPQQGLAVKDGMVYYLRQNNPATGESRLTRVKAATGEIVAWPATGGAGQAGHAFPITGPNSWSMTALGDRLYVANAALNKLTVIKIADGKVEKTIEVASPKSVAGDEKNKLLWVVSGATPVAIDITSVAGDEKNKLQWVVSGATLVAIDADGKPVTTSAAVADPADVAACDGKLAVASHKTGKIHFFDASNPAALKATGELGKGDGPYGKFELDRFFFQKAPAWGVKLDDISVSVALNSKGQVGVCESNTRVSMFDKTGKNLWYTHGVFGNQSRPSYSTGNRRLWDMYQSISFLMDEKTGTWQVEALWDFSAMTPKGLKESWVQPLGDFADGGQTFLVAVSGAYGKPAKVEQEVPMLMVARLDGFKAVPVLAISDEAGKLVSRKDANHDGKITADDAPATTYVPPPPGASGRDAWGQPMQAKGFQRFNDLQADGSILIMNRPAYIWKRTGLDADGVPVYEGKNYLPLPNKDWNKDLSPYDFKPDGMAGFVQVGMLSDGGYVGQTIMRGSGGMGLNNGAGTDLCGYGPDGRTRWVNQLAQYHGIAGMGTVDDITVTAIFYSMDVLVVDRDGLGLGNFCESPQLHYCGYWIDHPNLRLFKMPDGRVYFTNGDNTAGRHNWYRLENQASLNQHRHPFTLNPQRATELAAAEFKPAPTVASKQPAIKINRLAAPFTIDGSLEKWRTAGVKPQIIMLPMGAIEGAADASSLIRIAYEGQNLYFQVLSFDDVPVFGNFPVWQDSVELALNGVTPNGMQFVAARNNDGKDVVWRNRFFAPFPPMFIDPKHAPCVVKVLDNAQDVPERQLIERLCGEDLSKAKVIVTEFKIPLDKETYVKAESDIPELGSGKTFWINFFIDDSDHPYTDVQEAIINWPVGSGMFGAKEEGAFATCE